MRIPHRTSVEHDMQLLVSPGHVGGCVRTGEGVGSRVGGRRNDRGTGRGRGLLAGAGSVRCSAEGAGRAEGRQAWETAPSSAQSPPLHSKDASTRARDSSTRAAETPRGTHSRRGDAQQNPHRALLSAQSQAGWPRPPFPFRDNTAAARTCSQWSTTRPGSGLSTNTTAPALNFALTFLAASTARTQAQSCTPASSQAL